MNQKNGWIMAQKWKDVAFLHYKVDPKILQAKVPFKLDLFDGQGIISIVSFKMESIRFPFLPSLPGLSSLNELNLRTYVEVNGIKGVYFFTLDADHRAGIWIAQKFFSLPYNPARISLEVKDESYSFKSKSENTSLGFTAKRGFSEKTSHFDLWATERYSLFTQRDKQALRGVVMHSPWKLEPLSLTSIDDQFSSQLGHSLKAESYFSLSFSHELDVKFKPFYKCQCS